MVVSPRVPFSSCPPPSSSHLTHLVCFVCHHITLLSGTEFCPSYLLLHNKLPPNLEALLYVMILWIGNLERAPLALPSALCDVQWCHLAVFSCWLGWCGKSGWPHTILEALWAMPKTKRPCCLGKKLKLGLSCVNEDPFICLSISQGSCDDQTRLSIPPSIQNYKMWSRGKIVVLLQMLLGLLFISSINL